MAKQYFNLYPSLVAFENLFRAYENAARGKRGQSAIASFDYHLEDKLFRLQDELTNKTYQPGHYRSFYIYDPKKRLVSAAPFRDRVVHHALCQIIEPLFERTFIGDSFANRIGKGTHAALARAQYFSQRYLYVLQCDLKQFFPSVDHVILHRILSRKIGDADVMNLCQLFLTSGEGLLEETYDMVYFPNDDLLAANRLRGLPIGNLTSQFWANVYLNEIDQFVKRNLHCAAYLRYVDDFLLFADNKKQLWEWKSALIDKLNELRLSLHLKSSTVYPVKDGMPFLGFRQYPDHRRLKRRNGVAFVRRWRRYLQAIANGKLTTDDLQRRARGWVAHVQHGDTWGLRRALLSNPIPADRS